MQEGKLLTTLAVGLVVAILFTSILVVVKEENPGVKDWLKATFSHHWIGHGILTLAVFALSSLIAYPFGKGMNAEKSTWTVLLVTVIGILIILVFYLVE